MGTYGGKGFMERAAVSGERPIRNQSSVPSGLACLRTSSDSIRSQKRLGQPKVCPWWLDAA